MCYWELGVSLGKCVCGGVGVGGWRAGEAWGLPCPQEPRRGLGALTKGTRHV